MLPLSLLIWRLTVRKEGSDETGNSSYNVGGDKGKASANPFDGEQDEYGGGKLHQPRDEEVDVDVSSQDAQPHDQTLVDDSAGEPEGQRGRSSYVSGFTVVTGKWPNYKLTSCN